MLDRLIDDYLAGEQFAVPSAEQVELVVWSYVGIWVTRPIRRQFWLALR